MDPLYIVGLLVALLAIALSTIIDGNSFGPLIGPSGLMLVVVGTLGAGIMAYRVADLKYLPSSAIRAVMGKLPSIGGTIDDLARLADTARREGMLALESKLEGLEDRFVKLGVQLLVDGADEEVVRDTMEIEIDATDTRHRDSISFFRTLAAYAPTVGMFGTVIGLINMLGNLSDPSQLGKGMSLALLTTLYGVVMANLIFNPMAARLERLNTAELTAMEVVLDGVLTIRRGASPRALIERLESYLPPSARIGATERLQSQSGQEAA